LTHDSQKVDSLNIHKTLKAMESSQSMRGWVEDEISKTRMKAELGDHEMKNYIET
jgi:hypothetical protein